jgi:nucleotide-binding universal stress UspA family protein
VSGARIVCGIDESAGARRVVEVAGDLARRLDAALTLLSVFQPVFFVPPEGRAADVSPDRKAQLSERRHRARATVVEVSAAAGGGIRIDRKVRAGDPARALIAEATRHEALFIVVGSRGHGAIRAAILGSVSSQVVREAECPVVVVPFRP